MAVAIVDSQAGTTSTNLSLVQVTEQGDLRITAPPNATAEQLVFISDICAFGKRVQVYKPWSRQEIYLLLENAARVALVAGDVAKGEIILKKAEDAYYRDMQTRNRLRYVTGAGIGVMVLIALTMLTVSLTNLKVVTLNLAEPAVIISLFAFAGIGSAASILTRLSTVDLKDETSKAMILLSGASKPLVAIAFASLAYVILKYKIIDLTIGSASQTDAVYWVVAFLCGFSERFTSDIITRIEPGSAQVNGQGQAIAR